MDIKTLPFRELIAGMAGVYNPVAGGDLKAVFYFKVTGEEPGDYALSIADGVCTFSEGVPASPSLTIETPSEIWKAVSCGELDGQAAFMQGKYKASGDFRLLMRMDQLFNAPE